MPADAGLAAAEGLQFSQESSDDLGNVSREILCDNRFQVYQGELPPLAAPTGFTAKAVPGGRAELHWNAVDGAAGYQLYRGTGSTTEPTPLLRLGAGSAYTDQPPTDGLYRYAITSLRAGNGQESESALATAVTVTTDSVAPAPPSDLMLELTGQGIYAAWQPAVATEPVTYNFYRDDATVITSLAGLTPIRTGISQTEALDASPSPTHHAYVVAAVDAAGNLSLPSNSYYLNFALLPVSHLEVIQVDELSPLLTWTHSGGVAGYNVFLDEAGVLTNLGTALITEPFFTDTAFMGGERSYLVVAKDSFGVTAPGRAITLPDLTISRTGNTSIRRNVLNRLDYELTNHTNAPIANMHLAAEIGGRNHASEPFTLGAGETKTVPVVVGGYATLPETTTLAVTAVIAAGADGAVEIVRTETVTVLPGMLVAGIMNEEFLRGATGRVRFTLTNTGSDEMEIITATRDGASPSNEITFSLLDGDNNVLATTPFRQYLGSACVTLPNGVTVARIPAGETFTSEPVAMSVPLLAPEKVTLLVGINKVYSRYAKPEQVTIDGVSSRRTIALIDTAYYGEVTAATPAVSSGALPIVITGRAVERATGAALARVPLRLVVAVSGFERAVTLYTGDDGRFTHTFTPNPGEAGLYDVWAVHPDLLDKAVQASFVINRVAVTPTLINLAISKNYEQALSIAVDTGAGTTVTNLRLVYEAADQAEGVLPTGIHVTPGPAIGAVAGGKRVNLTAAVWADNSASGAASLVFKVKSDESGAGGWATVTVNAQFSHPRPVLTFAPTSITTGVGRGETVSETITLGNKGLASLTGVTLTLLDAAKLPAPGWVSLTTAAAVGEIRVGDSGNASFAISPPETVAEGSYTFYLRIAAANYQTMDIPISVAVTQAGEGSVLFKLADIYTGSQNSSGAIIQGVAAGRIQVQNEKVLTIERTLTTDAAGEALFTDLPTGAYKCRITAADHDEYIGRFWIKPGITVNQEVFLNASLVTVEWEVVETTIQDKYEVVLHTTYETDVPAAVVAAAPTAVTIPDMEPGDVFTGEFTITNLGLLRADNLNITLPENDPYFHYEALAGLPDHLDAKASLTIPYRVTSIQKLGGSGSGCSYQNLARVAYSYVCKNGVKTQGEAKTYFTKVWSCATSGGVSGPPVFIPTSSSVSIASAGGGGSVPSSAAPTGTPIGESFCKKRPAAIFSRDDKPRYCELSASSQSRVELMRGDYMDSRVDLAVKAPGGSIAIERRYYDNGWHFGFADKNLTLKWGMDNGAPESIAKDGVTYQPINPERTIYAFGSERTIRAMAGGGYRWEYKSGIWQEFAGTGRLLAYGDRVGTIAQLQYDEGGHVTSITDRNNQPVLWLAYATDQTPAEVYDGSGRKVSYFYDGGRIVRFEDALGGDYRYSYDTDGRLHTKTDPLGRVVTIAYDDSDYVRSVTDEGGGVQRFEYSYDSGKRQYATRVTAAAGKIEDFWYNEQGRKIRADVNGRTVEKVAFSGRNRIVTDERGNTTTEVYDEWENLTRRLLPDAAELRYDYDGNANMIRKVDEIGVATLFEYDGTGQVVKLTEAAGTTAERVTVFGYDVAGNLTSRKTLGDEVTAEAVTALAYDDAGNVTAITAPEGGTTSFTYDVMGNILTRTDPRGKFWTSSYDALGEFLATADPLGYSNHFSYDQVGRRVKVLDPLAHETAFAYDVHGNMTGRTDPAGKVTTFAYNQANQLTQETDPEGKTVRRHEYDLDGRLVKIFDGAGNATTLQYDEASGAGSCSSCSGSGSSAEPTRITYPTFSRVIGYDERGRKITEKEVLSDTDQPATALTYDKSGNLLAMTDREGKITQYEYDSLNRVTKTTDAQGGTTLYGYDDRGNLLQLTDAEGNTTRFEYDRNNRMTKEIRPKGEAILYQYDQAGNLAARIDPKGQKSAFVYDDASRLAETKYFATTAAATPVKTVHFTYNAAGNLTAYDDGATSAAYVYNAVGRKTAETVNYGPFALTHAYEYDGAGRKTALTTPDGSTYRYTYDSAGHLASVIIPGQGSITYNSYTWTRPALVTLPGGAKRQYAYDPLMRTKEISLKDPAQTATLGYNYTYDKMDNVTAKATEHGTYAYTYDPLYRLTAADNPTLTDEGYSYDKTGNCLTDLAAPGDWTYDENNKLLSAGATTYDYDANGNLTEKTVGTQTTHFIYDLEDHLARVETGTGTLIAEYTYDPFGRRLWKEVNGTTTYFLYSDEGLIGEYNETGAAVTTYGYTPDSTWSTAPLFMKQGSSYYFYQNDHLGTPQKLTDTSGAVVWSATYNAFGKAAVDVITVKNNLRFPGQIYDEETGLHYNWHRYYSPEIGRYITEDTIGFLGGDVNLYNYVWANPANWIDPNGQYGLWGAGIGTAIGGVSGYYASGGTWQGALAGAAIGGTAGFFGQFGGSWRAAILVGAAVGGAENLAWQLAIEQKSLECIDTAELGKSILLGALTSGLGHAVDAAKAAKNVKKPARSFVDVMTPDEAARYRKYWEKHAHEQSQPFDVRRRYTESGDIKQVTTYDEFGSRHRQYDLLDQRRGEHQHDFTYDALHPKPKGQRSDHLPMNE